MDISIELCLEDLLELEKLNVIRKDEHVEDSQDNANIPRLAHWMTTRDCAIVTAWRYTKTRQENDENNNCLQKQLRLMRYGVIKVRGCYAEVGKEASKENSFFVINLPENGEKFLNDVFDLATKYEQDSFLYKKAGTDETAYLIGTNDDFGMNRREIAGKMHVNTIRPGAFSEIGSGRIVFE